MYQLTTLKTLCESSEMATAFGVASMTGHVFIVPGIEEFQGSMNIGRLPCILIKDLGVDYTFDAVSDHFMTRTSEFQIRLLVGTTLNIHQTKYELLQTAKVALIKKIVGSTGLSATDFREDPAKLIPYSLAMDLYFTSDTSADSSMTEA